MLSFMHFRSVNTDGTINSRGGATVAFKLTRDGSKVDKFAVALCSPNDNFDRRRGREIAGGRLHDPLLSRQSMGDTPASFRAMMEERMKARGLMRPIPKGRKGRPLLSSTGRVQHPTGPTH